MFQELFEKANAVASARIDAFLGSSGSDARRGSLQLPIPSPTALSSAQETTTSSDQKKDFQSSKSSGRRATVGQINTSGANVPRYLAGTKSSASKVVSSDKVYGKENRGGGSRPPTPSGRPPTPSGRPPKPNFSSNSKTYFALKPAKPVPGSRTPSVPTTPTSPSTKSFFGGGKAPKVLSVPSSPASKSPVHSKTTKTFSAASASRSSRPTTPTPTKPSKPISEPNSPVTKNAKLSVFHSNVESSSSGSAHKAQTATTPVRKSSTSESVPSYLNPTRSSARKSYSREKVVTSKSLLEPAKASADSPPEVRKNVSELRASFEQKPAKPVVFPKGKPQYTREKVVTTKTLLGSTSPEPANEDFSYSVKSATTSAGVRTVPVETSPTSSPEPHITNGNLDQFLHTWESAESPVISRADQPSSPTTQTEVTEIKTSATKPSDFEAYKSYTSPGGSYTRGSYTTTEAYEPSSTNGTTEHTEIKSSSTVEPIGLDGFGAYASPLDSYTRVTRSSNLYEPSSVSKYREIKTSGVEPDSDSSSSYTGSARRAYTRDKLRSINSKTQADPAPSEPSRRELITSRYKTTTTTTTEPLAIPRITVTQDTEEFLPPSSAKGTNFARRSILESSAANAAQSDAKPKKKTFSLSDDLEAEFKETQDSYALSQEEEEFPNQDTILFDDIGGNAGFTPGLDSYQYLHQTSTSDDLPEGQLVTVASSDDSFPAQEGSRLFNSRHKSSQNWVRSFPARNSGDDIYISDSSSITPEIYEDRGHEYSYVTTETRKVRPKDQKILSYETTEKVAIPQTPVQEVEEFEKISIETPHISGLPLPEISAHKFGSPPTKLVENLQKSHFEFTASDAPIPTPPIEKYRQAVVDKWLEGKTRGGTRTYRSSWAVGNRGAQTSSQPTSALAQFERLPPEPILYQPSTRTKSSYHTKSIHTESIPGPFFANKHSDFFDSEDPGNYIASTVYRTAQRDKSRKPVTVTYGEFSDEENTSPRSVQPSTQSDEDFVPIKVEVVRKQRVPAQTKKVKKTTKTVTTSRSGGRAPHGFYEVRDQNDEIDDLNGTVEYVDSREYRNTSPMRRSTQRSEVVRERVSMPGGGYQIRESRSTSGGRGARGSSPPRSSSGYRQSRSPPRRADNMDAYVVATTSRGQPPKEKKFLKKVQHELEQQRGHWKDEVEKMADSFTLKNKVSTRELQSPDNPDTNSNSYVDHSSGYPVFKAFVDVSDYPASGLDVSIDNLENKVVVKAAKRGADGITRSFTQKVQLPRYADDKRLVTKLSREGVLRVEVPLMFHFQPEKKKSKSFINQVVTKPDGSKYIEVLVNVGHDTNAWNLRVLVDEKDQLLVMADKNVEYPDGEVKKASKLIKRYILPQNAIVGGIKSKLGRDGRLMVTIPLAETMSD